MLHTWADGKGGQKIENTGPLTKKRMETIDDEVTGHALAWMETQAKAQKPFFLWYNTTAMHFRTHVAEKNKGKSGQGDYNDQMAAHDEHIGEMLNKLDELGIAQHTYVIFTTDHGSPGRNPPLAGGKGTVSEGGLRVPFIIRGPGVQPGACSHVRAIGDDLFPTIAALAQVSEPLPKGIEGGSLVPVLTHGGVGAVERPREESVVHFPHYDKDIIGPASAIYLGDLKLIRIYETGEVRLFNLASDLGERRDLSREIPDKAKELDQRLSDYLAAVDAQMPRLNPNYDSTRPTETKRGGRRRVSP